MTNQRKADDGTETENGQQTDSDRPFIPKEIQDMIDDLAAAETDGEAVFDELAEAVNYQHKVLNILTEAVEVQADRLEAHEARIEALEEGEVRYQILRDVVTSATDLDEETIDRLVARRMDGGDGE